jgi:hypothetical protein
LARSLRAKRIISCKFRVTTDPEVVDLVPDTGDEHAEQTLSGQQLGTVHTMAAIREPDGRFLVYDPNTGRAEYRTLTEFRAFIRTMGATAYVVAEPGAGL